MFIFFLALIVAEIAVFFNTMSSPRLTKLSSRRLTKLLPFQVTLNIWPNDVVSFFSKISKN